MKPIYRTLSAVIALCLLQAGCSKQDTDAKKPVAPPVAAAPDSRLMALDRNADKKLSFEEWSAASSKQFDQYKDAKADEIVLESALAYFTERREKARKALKNGLADNENPVKRREWEARKRGLTTYADMSDDSLKASATGLIERYDFTGDGKVARDEWLAPLREQFSAIDTNRDRTLSHEELSAYDKKMRSTIPPARQPR